MRKLLTILICGLSFSTIALSSDFCDKYDCRGFADSLIADDAQSWFINRYDRGSARVVGVWTSPSGLKTKVKVEYTYNGGRGGWAELTFLDGEFSCIRYWDFPNDCRSRKKF